MKTKKAKTTLGFAVLVVLALLGFSLLLPPAHSQPGAGQPDKPGTEELRVGKNFIPTKVYSTEEDEQVLRLFEGLRVSDVADGMDKAGLCNIGLMSPEIHAAWKDTVHFAHRFVGVAVTVRYVPTNNPPAPQMETKEFDRWVAKWYSELSSEPFVPLVRKGTAASLRRCAGLRRRLYRLEQHYGLEAVRLCRRGHRCHRP